MSIAIAQNNLSSDALTAVQTNMSQYPGKSLQRRTPHQRPRSYVCRAVIVLETTLDLLSADQNVLFLFY